uniref:Uncharacterized protein n=1 Tax=Lactuca sativa TaxID=4236 RepID=A0A9R1UYC1_LACSA|nr:hypothetical protein LSAT_V11C700381230 [Lactuca sativa]
MARMIDIGGNSGGILNFEGSHIAFMLCMIVVSMSVLSMIIFACGDSGDHKSEKKHRRNNHAFAFGGIAGAASSGGGGGGGGGCGGGGGGGGGGC